MIPFIIIYHHKGASETQHGNLKKYAKRVFIKAAPVSAATVEFLAQKRLSCTPIGIINQTFGIVRSTTTEL